MANDEPSDDSDEALFSEHGRNCYELGRATMQRELNEAKSEVARLEHNALDDEEHLRGLTARIAELEAVLPRAAEALELADRDANGISFDGPNAGIRNAIAMATALSSAHVDLPALILEAQLRTLEWVRQATFCGGTVEAAVNYRIAELAKRLEAKAPREANNTTPAKPEK